MPINLSVIIPVINEEKNLVKILVNLEKHPDIEFIFVDGGSQDNTVKLIKQADFQVILSPILRRSYQMNLGADNAQGKILLFLHGDTLLPQNYGQIINDIVNKKDFILGAFALNIDCKKPIFRLLEMMVNARSNYLSLPYGDQGIFLKKEVFEQLGKYQDIAIMEDFELVKKAQKYGKIYIAKSAVTTSSRRWNKLGIIKTTLINQLIIMGYYLKISPEKLALFYRQMKK
ncbi:TIGR04283 family arsenosugar biosynthesis glycosyltransferase [Geminocystis sp. CENA526]|uniref:TIGR04283 family arsenosugar biosynthesis glycosyltransferase n=1 Tax=Geminocystis sp. CENA526 TaxID=1355871 RepID=UPI003D6FEB64